MYSSSGAGLGKRCDRLLVGIDRRVERLQRRKHLAEKPRQLGSLDAGEPLRHVLVNRKAQLVALSSNFKALLREGHRDRAIVVLGPSTTQQLAFSSRCS